MTAPTAVVVRRQIVLERPRLAVRQAPSAPSTRKPLRSPWL